MRRLLLALGFSLLCGTVAAQAQMPITQSASLRGAATGICTLATAHQHQ